jgi:hypothetical protein
VAFLTRNRVVLEVDEVRGRCPIYKKGDKIVVDPVPGENVSTINLKETTAICTRVLGGALLSYTLWLEYAKPGRDDDKKLPWQRALGPDPSKCPMPGPPYSECGYVTFKAMGIPQENR